MYNHFLSVLNIDTLLSRLAIELASVQVVPRSLVIVQVIVNVVDAGSTLAQVAAHHDVDVLRSALLLVGHELQVSLVGTQCTGAANLHELLAVAYVVVGSCHVGVGERLLLHRTQELVGYGQCQVGLVAWNQEHGLRLVGIVVNQEWSVPGMECSTELHRRHCSV